MLENGLTKKQRKEMRELQGLAWRRELEDELGILENHFASWREGLIDTFELSDQIHRFHNGVSRDLFKYYSGNDYMFTVPGAIAKGRIDESEVSKELLEIISEDIEPFTGRLAASGRLTCRGDYRSNPSDRLPSSFDYT